jgi:hypothetical protein
VTLPLSTLSDSEMATVRDLCRLHDDEKPELEAYDRWYEGTEQVRYLHEDLFQEMHDRIPQVRIFLPQVAVDSIAERLGWEGFRTGDDDLDEDLQRVWDANDLDLGLTQAITDALVMRRSYFSIGTNEEDPDTPIVRPESPLELFVRNDARTRKATDGLRRWCVYDLSGSLMEEYATLYLPDSTIWMERKGGGWVVTDRDDHKLGEVPIASLVNRPRTSAVRVGPRPRTRIGRSDLDPVIPLAHSLTKMATDMMVAAERVAIPLRVLFGAGPDQFKDDKGNPMTPMQALLGGLLAIPEPDVRAYEFAAAQLANFTTGMRELSNQAGSVTGLPPHYVGTPSDNPASAEAIISSESRLATRAEQKQVPFEAGVVHAAWLWRRIQTGEWDPAVKAARGDWRDVRTPTVGAQADAAVKLYQAKIVPLKQTREKLRYDPDEIEAMEDQDELDAVRSPAGRLAGAMTAVADDGTGGQPSG